MKINQLHQLFLTSNSICTDTRKLQTNDLFFALKGDNFNGNEFVETALKNGASYCIIDEKKYKTSSKTILVNDALSTLQNLAKFHRTYLKVPIIALTGSNGKTTTKELINIVLSKKYTTVATVGNLNNHIGVPLTLLSMNSDTEIGIVEMGANHLKEIDFLCHIAQPDFGYITNFGKAHLEGFGGKDGVIKGKSELYDFLIRNNKHLFLNADDPIQIGKSQAYIKKMGFSTKNTNYYKISLEESSPFVKVKVEDYTINSHLIGAYNFTNICASIIIGRYFNIDLTLIKKAIENYIPTNNRSQIIEKGSAKIILDAYNANPTSMEVALQNLSELEGDSKIVILGDMFELGQSSAEEHQFIANLTLELQLDSVILIGENFYRTKNSDSKIKTYASFDDFKSDFNSNSIENSTVLIKGSRGMALERVLELLK